MANRDIVVMGGSAGSLQAIKSVLEGLEASFAGSVFLVTHLPPYRASVLPEVLRRSSRLPVRHPADGDAFQPGTIYVAPPDRHLLVFEDRIGVTLGPRENNARPAIDPLFRTAAVAHHARAVGVLLSGMLDDGTAGMQSIHECGGVTVVQDPEEALHGDMPRNALAALKVDHCLPAANIGPLLTRLAREPAPRHVGKCGDELDWESAIAAADTAALDSAERPGSPAPFSCPHCHGTLWETDAPGQAPFRCRIGHAFTDPTLLECQSVNIDTTLNEAFRALKEKEHLARRMAKQASKRGDGRALKHYEEEANAVASFARNIWEMLSNIRKAPPPEPRSAKYVSP